MLMQKVPISVGIIKASNKCVKKAGEIPLYIQLLLVSHVY